MNRLLLAVITASTMMIIFTVCQKESSSSFYQPGWEDIHTIETIHVSGDYSQTDDSTKSLLEQARAGGWDGITIIYTPGKPRQVIFFKKDEWKAVTPLDSGIKIKIRSIESQTPLDSIEDIESYMRKRMEELFNISTGKDSSKSN
jgi:hypothetical protein